MSPSLIPDDSVVLNAWRNGVLDALITKTLAPIVGEPFMELGRAADLIWIGFGEEVPSPTSRAPDRRLSRHRLHVGCPLRLDNLRVPVVAAGDMFQSAVDPSGTSPDFQWDVRGANLFDSMVEKFWNEHKPGLAVVDGVEGDPAGGVTLTISGGYMIRIFPNRSGPTEHWRYFRAGEGAHFVVLPGDA